MQYGVYFMSVGDVYADAALLAELAHEAEESGWDGMFIWDHMGKPEAAADPWVTLAAMAVKTQRLIFGPIITPVARRRPWKLARETVTLDHLSHGRLVLGVGLGYRAEEFEVFGEVGDPKILAEKLDEGLEVLAGLWQAEPFSHSGKYYQLTDVRFLPKPVQQPRIPIWACGAWSDKRAPFRRGARWDGMIAVAPEDRPLSPAEVKDIRAYMEKFRENSAPFDLVTFFQSENDGSAKERERVEEYRAAGVTWWVEDHTQGRYPTLEEARKRLHKGPPRS